MKRRISGEPVHRILGFREFYGLRLALSAETLEPRPDTETLVEAVLPFVRETAAREGICRILDLGTGTGAIALALLAEVEKATATGVDISADALATARRNAETLGLGARFIGAAIRLVRKNFRPVPFNCRKPTLYTHQRACDLAKRGQGFRSGKSP